MASKISGGITHTYRERQRERERERVNCSKTRFLLPTLFLSLFSLTFLFFLSPTNFVLGEQSSSVGAASPTSNDDIGNFAVNGEGGTVSFVDPLLTIDGGFYTISMEEGVTSTSQRIEVTGGATVTLDGVTIDDTTDGPAITISGSQDVTILIADGSKNVLTGKAGDSSTYDIGFSGIQKTDSASGWLIIGIPENSEGTGELEAIGGYYATGIGGGRQENGSNIKITGGNVIANGGASGAGIGGGGFGNGTDITISGGTVTATGGLSGAGIGGGEYATGGNITISDNAVVTATGGERAAGIGGGNSGNGSGITISGGTVTATGGLRQGNGGAGIGGGASGSASDNKLDGDAVVMAANGGDGKDVLEGFVDSQGDSLITRGIVFTGVVTDYTTDPYTVDWEKGKQYGNSVTITEDTTFPADFTITSNVALTVGKNADGKEATLSMAEGKELTVEGSLINEGVINIPAEKLTCNRNGKVTAKTDFYRNGSTEVYKTGYQIYQTKEGVQKYKDLPNPDDTTLRKSSNDAGNFEYWYYLDASGNKVPINNTVDVLLNQHAFYEKREAIPYTITVSSTENGTITSDKAEAAKDETVTLTVTPDEGYQLQAGTLKVAAGSTEIVLTDKGDSTYTFSMPASDVAVSAIFEPIPGPGPDPTPTDTVTLTFRTNEGSWNSITETTREGAPDAAVIAPVYPDVDAIRTCIGWFDEAGKEVVSGVTTFGEVTGIVTARFVDTPGWHQNATGWWYVYDLSNNYYTNCWALINSAWFYFNDAGYCLEYTWGYINGEWYFFGWGGYMQTGWQWISGSWYFLDRYTGAMKCGWVHDGVWYYLNPETGAMYDNCWAYINGNWYGFNEGGSMTQGWSYSYAYDGWFYLQPETGHMLYSWQYIGGHWYYFYDNGLMAANTYVGNYWLGADGAMW